MKTLNIKLAIAALALAMLAAPALAAGTAATQSHYPDGGANRTGSAQSYESGAIFN